MRTFARVSGKSDPPKMLYFYAHNYEYFKTKLSVPFQLMCWRSISVPFMKIYLHEGFFGKKILEKIYKMEEENPTVCGLKGEYPMFVFEK
jgi:hypothetical protein